MNITDISEFDEQAGSKAGALSNYRNALSLYFQGKESMGIVDAYELAARGCGATTNEICAIYREVKKEYGHSAGH